MKANWKELEYWSAGWSDRLEGACLYPHPPTRDGWKYDGLTINSHCLYRFSYVFKTFSFKLEEGLLVFTLAWIPIIFPEDRIIVWLGTRFWVPEFGVGEYMSKLSLSFEDVAIQGWSLKVTTSIRPIRCLDLGLKSIRVMEHEAVWFDWQVDEQKGRAESVNFCVVLKNERYIFLFEFRRFVLECNYLKLFILVFRLLCCAKYCVFMSKRAAIRVPSCMR